MWQRQAFLTFQSQIAQHLASTLFTQEPVYCDLVGAAEGLELDYILCTE